MKRNLLFVILLFAAFNAFAQAPFTHYRPAPDVQYSPQPSNDYNNLFNYNYNTTPNYYNSTPQPQQQEPSQILSTRGYYIKNGQWNSVLLKVKVVGERVYVVGIKRENTGWNDCNYQAYTTNLMQQEIKQNFDYYIGDYNYGKIYF